MKPTVRATSLAQQAAIPDHELRAGTDIVDQPQRADEASVEGHYDTSACTHYGPANAENLAAFWELWLDDDTGAL